MEYGYILEGHDSEHFYVGITDDSRARLAKRNAGKVPHTSKYRPWQIKTCVAFTDEKQAFELEKYLKGVCEEAPLKLIGFSNCGVAPPGIFAGSRVLERLRNHAHINL
jgi:putative endonuclease